jgi:bacterioferritin-associated ferredoxin
MLVCHCKAVFERRVREAIAAGARSEFDVAIACGAGTGCGGCVPSITRLLLEAAAGSGAKTKDNRTSVTSSSHALS